MRSFFSRLGLPLCFLTCTGFSGVTLATNLVRGCGGDIRRFFGGSLLRCGRFRVLRRRGGFRKLGSLVLLAGVLFRYVFLDGGHAVTGHRRDGLEDGGHAVVGVGVAHHFAVHQLDDAGGVALRELRIVRDHDDQPVIRDLLQKVHDLLRGLGVQRARGFVGEDDLRIVDDGARDGDALHLSARHLVGLLFELSAQPHALERSDSHLPLLLAGDAGDGERKLNVLQDVEVRDEVVALENETDGTVAVCVPVAGLEFLGGLVVDDEVAVGVLIQPADDVEQGGLAAARRTEDGDKFALAEVEVDTSHSVHDGVRHAVVLDDVDEFKHTLTFSADDWFRAPGSRKNSR